MTLGKSIVLLTAMAIMVAAFGSRWENLSRIDFNIDELNHVYAAKSIKTNGDLLLPSGKSYARAYGFTRICALTLDWLPHDRGARLPSFFFGIATLAVLFWLTRRWFGDLCALLTLFFMAFSFEHSVYSFFTRMYTLQQLLFLMMVMVGFQLVHFPISELSGKNVRSGGAAAVRPWLRAGFLIAAFATLFLIAIHIHQLNLIILIILYVYSLWELGVDMLHRGIREAKNTGSFWVALCGSAIAAIIFLVFSEDVAMLYKRIRRPLSWAVANADNTKYYYQVFKEYYPFLWSLFPACAIVLIVSKGRYARLVVAAFCIPFLFQSLFLATKAQRYLFYALPYFFIIVSYGISVVMNGLVEAIKPISSRLSSHFLRNAMLGCLTVVLIGWILKVNDPSFLDRSLQIRSGASNVLAGVSFPKWSTIAEKLRPYIDESIVIISAETLPTLHYLGQVDYAVNPDYMDNSIKEPRSSGAIRYFDYYTRSPYILTIEEFESIFSSTPKGIVILKQTATFNPKKNLFEGAVESYAHHNLRYHEDLKGKYFIYSWGLDGTP